MRTEVKKIELVRDGVGCQVMVVSGGNAAGCFGHWVVVLVVAGSTPQVL